MSHYKDLYESQPGVIQAEERRKELAELGYREHYVGGTRMYYHVRCSALVVNPSIHSEVCKDDNPSKEDDSHIPAAGYGMSDF